MLGGLVRQATVLGGGAGNLTGRTYVFLMTPVLAPTPPVLWGRNDRDSFKYNARGRYMVHVMQGFHYGPDWAVPVHGYSKYDVRNVA